LARVRAEGGQRADAGARGDQAARRRAEGGRRAGGGRDRRRGQRPAVRHRGPAERRALVPRRRARQGDLRGTMSRRRVGVAAGVLASGGAAAGALAVPALAAAPKPVVQKDPAGDVNGPLDLRQFVLARGTDGRLRVSLTLNAYWDADDLLSDSGP